jgi:hypothetical protein
MVQPLGNLQPPAAGNQGPRQFEKNIVNVITHLPADLQGVPKTAGGQKPRPGPLAFNDQVGHQGRPVDGFHNLSGRDSIAFQHFPDHLGDRPGGVVRGGQPFPQKKPTGSRIQDNHICKRSANVNTHLEFVRHCFVLRSFLRYELPPKFSLLSGVSPKLF